MPQFDPDFFATQLVWLAVAFILLYVVMARVALPRIARVLEDRRRRIDDNLERAEALRREAEAVASAYAGMLAEGRAKAQALLKEAADGIAAKTARRSEEFARELAETTREAERRIEGARRRALANVRAVAAEAARAATARLTGIAVGEGEAEAAVAAAVKERR